MSDPSPPRPRPGKPKLEIPGHSYADLPRSEIAQGVDNMQRILLRGFFGLGLSGALAGSHSFRIPSGLTGDTLVAIS